MHHSARPQVGVELPPGVAYKRCRPAFAHAAPGQDAHGELTMGYKVAVVGATGNVGREMLEILAERAFPADEVVAIASRRSQGVECSYGDQTLKVKALDHYDFSEIDI